jgi:parallel beta-helix repeat protein
MLQQVAAPFSTELFLNNRTEAFLKMRLETKLQMKIVNKKYEGVRMKKTSKKLNLALIALTTLVCGSLASAATVPSAALNVRKYGAVGDGAHDDTKAIQNAIAAVGKNGTVYVPAGKYLVNVSEKNNLKMKSNMKFQMDPKAILVMKPNSLQRSYLINISNATNVEVFGGQLIGDRDKHLSTGGEWGMGVNIIGKSSNVKVHNMKISNFWGDGVYVGGNASQVVINHVVSTNNRRQGLSITDASHVQVLNSEFSYTNGTAPQYGIDIEPNNKTVGASDILIQGCYIHHNTKAGGIQLYKQSKNVQIKNNRIIDNIYGIYSVEAIGGVISGNRIAHNRYQGISLNKGTSDYQVSNNLFVNNSTKAVGVINPDYNPDVVLTGLSSKTNPHMLTSASTNIKVGSNTYRK